MKPKPARCHCTAYPFPHRPKSGACAVGDMPYTLLRTLRGPDPDPDDPAWVHECAVAREIADLEGQIATLASALRQALARAA